MKLCAPATKVKKAKYEDEEPDDVVDQAKAVVMIRQQITLKENVHFEIKVTLLKDSSNLTPSVLCKGCDKSTLLGFKGGNVLLSNWTRYIIKCVEKPKTPASKESKIQDFFSHKVIPNKSRPSSESFSTPETSEALHDKLPSASLSCKSFSAPETLPQTPEDLQVENTRNSDGQVFRKAPPAHC